MRFRDRHNGKRPVSDVGAGVADCLRQIRQRILQGSFRIDGLTPQFRHAGTRVGQQIANQRSQAAAAFPEKAEELTALIVDNIVIARGNQLAVNCDVADRLLQVVAG